MCSEDLFWVTVWKIFGAVVCVLIASVAGCTYGESRLVSDMVQRGATPIEARCAIAPSGDDMCLIQAAKK